MARVVLENISKKFGTVEAVKNFDLEVEDKEFAILVGPSGCGKSTALRMVAGLEEPTSGTIYIGDRAVNDLPPKDRDIAMVFQEYALYPHMSVYKNMAFGLKLRKFSKDEIDQRVKEASEILSIQNLLDRKPKQLSGGQRQRVAVGRAIVRKPAVFLFDEPLSNLDAKLRGQMRAEILQLQRRVGVTSLYVTHDQAEAMTLGDRIAVISAGRLLQLGTPEDVFRWPVNLFVAAFMGTPSMNLLRGEVAGGVLRAGSVELRAGGAPDGPVVLGFRPEALLPARSAAGLPQIEMTVDVVEELGNETLVYGEVPGEVASVEIDPTLPPPLPGSRARVAARLQGFTDVHRGEALPLGLRVDALHVFDAASGAALAVEAQAAPAS